MKETMEIALAITAPRRLAALKSVATLDRAALLTFFNDPQLDQLLPKEAVVDFIFFIEELDANWAALEKALKAEGFRTKRLEDGVKNATINRTLEVVRTTVIRAARVWREDGKPWLTTAPLIEMLDEKAQKREPYPIQWAEQAKLLLRLPGHLQETVEFAVNTGARDENVCGLQWNWEVPVPELGRSVFVVPPEFFKTQRRHVMVLNDVAWAIVERRRGMHDKYVFTYTPPGKVGKVPQRIATQNNSAFQKARTDVGLGQVRVHDLRHTFGQRLRDAGVTEEDRALLLGHAVQGMPQHYATATLERLLEAANSVLQTRDRTMVLRVVNG